MVVDYGGLPTHVMEVLGIREELSVFIRLCLQHRR